MTAPLVEAFAGELVTGSQAKSAERQRPAAIRRSMNCELLQRRRKGWAHHMGRPGDPVQRQAGFVMACLRWRSGGTAAALPRSLFETAMPKERP